MTGAVHAARFAVSGSALATDGARGALVLVVDGTASVLEIASGTDGEFVHTVTVPALGREMHVAVGVVAARSTPYGGDAVVAVATVDGEMAPEEPVSSRSPVAAGTDIDR